MKKEKDYKILISLECKLDFQNKTELISLDLKESYHLNVIKFRSQLDEGF